MLPSSAFNMQEENRVKHYHILKLYPFCIFLSGPVFVVQWLFDEAQLTVDNIHLTGQPVQQGQWRYIQNLGIELRNTLKDVP